MLKLRRAVRLFAKTMEEELRHNDESKSGWEDADYDYLLERAKANLKGIKTKKLYGMNPNQTDKNHAIKCCVDCANFCMMLADVIRG